MGDTEPPTDYASGAAVDRALFAAAVRDTEPTTLRCLLALWKPAPP
ncbi:hypothetical protein PC123_g8533 [Phytophthora cactorum]|nr:hypothetical protein PC123_g8533 [Phytophthora cactorum]